MRRAAGVALLAAGLATAPGAAWAQRLILSLSSHQVAIDANYTGSQVVLYGLVEREGALAGRPGPVDVVVTVRGPRESVTVRRKEPLGPVWINRAQRKFTAVPSALGVFSTRPVPLIADPRTRDRFRLGLSAIVAGPELGFERAEDEDQYRAALIRLKTRDKLWRADDRGVTFVSDGWFRAPLPLAGNAPVGSYDVEAVLLSDGVVLARRDTSFEVVKAGFEEEVTTFSQDRGLAYGALAALLSIGFGWIASAIFRRD